jgi:ABC-type multidrug transport system ATPase subunit
LRQIKHPIISFRNVSKKYKKNYSLQEINLDVIPSEITGIIGPDGSGKSTLLKICSGVLSYEGTAMFMNTDLRKNSESAKRHLGFMPQGIGLNLYMDLSVDENVNFFAAIKNVPDSKRDQLKNKLFEATGLTPFKDRLAKHLSGGMKQKLGICCSVISNPDVLLLDEPSTGVDPLSRRQLWELLNGFITETGTTLIMATSYMDEAERCHSIRFLHEGKIIFSGNPEQLMSEEKDLEKAFFDILLEGKELPVYDVPFHANISADDSAAINIDGVSKYFGSFKAVDNVSLSVKKGEIFGFLGPNGAGKTTLLKCILALHKPEQGYINILGMESGSAELKKIIGYMSQVFSLYGDLTVKENIELYGTLYEIDRKSFKERMKWVIEVSGLVGMKNTIVNRLPLGIKQRLALGCSTLNLPSVLILDEPTAGVDPVARKSFWQLIRALSNKLGMTVIVTTHNLVEADYCDRIAIMNEGRIIAVDTPDNLRSDFIINSGEVYEVYPEASLDTKIFSSQQIAITPFGRRYHVWKKGLYDHDIKTVLNSHTLKYRYIRNIPPPMEDVFIYFLEKKGN